MTQGDLATPETVKDPDQARGEAHAYQRLLAGLARGKILVPDEAALSAVKKIATADDEASNYAEIAANHDALDGLLSLLEGMRWGGSGAWRRRLRRSPGLTVMTDDEMQRVSSP